MSSRGAFRVVMCPSCVVNNFFKHLLLPNHWANLDQTWQECSLGGPLQILFTDFDSIKNSGCHGNEIEFLAPLAVGQRAYVMVCCRPVVRPSVCVLTVSLNIFFSETMCRILMKFHRNVPAMVLFRIC